jgi:hypothetical protein
MCQLGDHPGHLWQDSVEKDASVQLLLEGGLVEVAVAHSPEDLEDADQGGRVD